MLKGQGYHTAFIGKWHVDHPDDVNTWASGHGFDYAAQEQWPARFNPSTVKIGKQSVTESILKQNCIT